MKKVNFLAVNEQPRPLRIWTGKLLRFAYIFTGPGRGNAQNGFAFMLKKKIQELSPAAVGEEGAQRPCAAWGPELFFREDALCYGTYVVTRFMGVLAQSVGADSVQKGKSMLAGKLGERVASSLVNLVDDGLSKDSAVSFPFDGEGVPARKTVVIANGILNDYLYDNYTAHKAGCSSSGNGRRGSFRSLPVVAASNFILEPGRMSLPQMISDIDKGLYITEVWECTPLIPFRAIFLWERRE
jgi:PmbA protein